MVHTYKTLKDAGYEVFPDIADQCLDYFGNGDVLDKSTIFVVVLNVPDQKDTAYILTTAETSIAHSKVIQNLEIELDRKHKFVSIQRINADKESVESFIQDAKEIEQSEKASIKTDDSPSLSKFKNVVKEAVQKGASDIHYYVDEDSAKYVFRIDGVLDEGQRMNVTAAREMMSAALNNASKGMSGFEDDTKPYDLPIEVLVAVKKGDAVVHEEVTLRLSRRGSKGYIGYKAVMRVNVKSNQSVTLSTCNYPSDQREILQGILNAPYGIFLATGPVGSGKSTTSSAMIEMFDQNRGGLTVEDPIEFDIQHPNIKQFQVDDNKPDLTLNAYLKVSLRQDPDLISIAEIRDNDVAKKVFEYSRVGTVMMSTLHTNEAIYTFPRLLDLGIPANELAASDTFLGILNQRLLRVICPSCKVKHPIDDVGHVWKHNSKGCKSCNKGFVPGRMTVSELLIPSVKDTDFITNRDWKGWRDDLLSRGFKTLALRAFELSRSGVICWDEVETKIPHAKIVKTHLDLFPGSLGEAIE